MKGLIADCRHSLRLYRRTAGTSVIAIVVLAVGMAGVTSFVSLYVDLFLRPHPGFEASHRLVTIGAGPSSAIVTADFVDRIAAESTSLEAAAGIVIDGYRVAHSAEVVTGELVTSGFFDGIRPRMALGRGFEGTEHQQDGERVVVISYHYWQLAFGGRADVIGETIAIQGRGLFEPWSQRDSEADPWSEFRIIGVMGRAYPGFFPARTDGGTEIWLPFEQGLALRILDSPDPAGYRASARSRTAPLSMIGIGRRAPGISADAVAGEIEARFAGDLPVTGSDPQARLWVHDGIVTSISQLQSVRFQLRSFLGSSILLALVAAANVSLFLLARAPVRRRELGIRMALGARSGRLARQLATEAGLLVLAATALGMACSVWLTNFVRGMPFLRLVEWRDVRLLDWRVLAIVGVFLTTLTLLVSLAPIVGLKRIGIAASSRQLSSRAGIAQRIAGTSQIAIAGMLGGAAAAFAWYLGSIVFGDPGFETRGLHVVRYSIISERYNTDPRSRFENFYVDQSRRREAFASLPGVSRVSLATAVPGMSNFYTAYFQHPADPTEQVSASMGIIDSEYVNLLGLELVHGRTPTESEPAAVLVNQKFAQEFWGRDDVVGEPLPILGQAGEVVGVLADLPFSHPAAEPGAQAFAIATQQIMYSGVALLESNLSSAELRDRVTTLADNGTLEIRIDEVTRLKALLYAAIAGDRARGLLAISAGALVVLLAALGYYGTQRYLVAAGRREYAIRASLGATPGAIGRLVVARGITMSLPGLIVGGLLSFITVVWVNDRFLSGLVPSLGITALVVLALGAILLSASLGPAREARNAAPAPLLREE